MGGNASSCEGKKVPVDHQRYCKDGGTKLILSDTTTENFYRLTSSDALGPGILMVLSAPDVAQCCIVSRAWHRTGTQVWGERYERLNGHAPDSATQPKHAYAESVRKARQQLQLRCIGSYRQDANWVQPENRETTSWLAFIGEPSCGRRFVAIEVKFSWSWCCYLGVMEAPPKLPLAAGPPHTAAETLNSNLWRVTARPPSRYEEDTLLLEGASGTQIDVNLLPQHRSFVRHNSENERQATFGILIDHGCVSFLMQSSSGRWSSTGMVARGPSELVPFVAHPLLEAKILDAVESPLWQGPLLPHDAAIAMFSVKA